MRIRSILSGLISCLPGGNRWLFSRYRDSRPDAGTSQARYCYSVWMRHLILANQQGPLRGVPHTVAELGPGNSLGTGLAALISGASKYHAFDVVTYSPNEANLAIFDQLVELFRARTEIPDRAEFSAIKTELEDHSFPSQILDEAFLERALAPERIAMLRAALENCASDHGAPISYVVPWHTSLSVANASVDMVLSMSVFEHIDDLDQAYRACAAWLKPDGLMSHEIDFRCHGLTEEWNGHWGHSELIWKLIRGRRPFLINRQPHSVHVAQLQASGFEILVNRPQFFDKGLGRADLARSFAKLSDEDIRTHNVYLLARRLGAGQ